MSRIHRRRTALTAYYHGVEFRIGSKTLPSGSRSEDWVAVWTGSALILLVLAGMRPAVPVFSWGPALGERIAWLETLGSATVLGILLLVLCAAATLVMGRNTVPFLLAFPAIFALAWAARVIAGHATVKDWGITYVIVALCLGMMISNSAPLPAWMNEGVVTEFYIKTGLVTLGTNVVFAEILRAGLLGLAQALLVILAIWYLCFRISRRLRLDDEFSAMLASAVSICGVSAAIATCGAVSGDRKRLSYVTSLVLIVAVPMTIVMPWVAERLRMRSVVGGAWLGGTIDTSGAVVAAGEILGESALNAAVIVKFSQNALLGLAAFAISLWWALRGDRAEERPTVAVIWHRFPKFVLGFIGASMLFSFIVSTETVTQTAGLMKELRTWWFALAFVCIGLETRFRDLVSMEQGRPALAFLIAQGANIVWTLLVAFLLFGGVVFDVPAL